MKRIFISSVQKEFERERAAIKRMIESDPILKPHFNVFVFEIDAPASDKSTQQVYLEEIEKSDIYLVLIGNRYGYCREGELSPTEREFDKARELGLTKLVMVRGKDNSKREEREARFLDKVSKERVRVRYQDAEPEQAVEDLLDEVAQGAYEKVVTVEDGVKNGGFGEAVMCYFADKHPEMTGKTTVLGIDDTFVMHGSVGELKHLCGIDAEGIYGRVLGVEI